MDQALLRFGERTRRAVQEDCSSYDRVWVSDGRDAGTAVSYSRVGAPSNGALPYRSVDARGEKLGTQPETNADT